MQTIDRHLHIQSLLHKTCLVQELNIIWVIHISISAAANRGILFVSSSKKDKRDLEFISPPTSNHLTVSMLSSESLCPASVCISDLRASIYQKNRTNSDGKTRKRQQTTVVQINQCIVFQKSSSSGSRQSEFITLLLFLQKRLQVRTPCRSRQIPLHLHILSTDSPPNIPPFRSPNQQRGGSIAVQMDAEVSRYSYLLMLEAGLWRSVLHTETWRQLEWSVSQANKL